MSTKAVISHYVWMGSAYHIEASPARPGCLRVFTTLTGKTRKFEICTVRGVGNRPALALSRVGRRGSARSSGKSQGGMTACGPNQSGCVRGKSIFIFPGGAAWTKRKGGPPVYADYKRKRR